MDPFMKPTEMNVMTTEHKSNKHWVKMIFMKEPL